MVMAKEMRMQMWTWYRRLTGSLSRLTSKIILHVRPSGFIDTISLILPHLDQAVGSTNAFLKIDGSELAEYMIDHGVGVTSEAIYELKRIDSDYFSEE
jgi:restriction endonuclease Mrr